MDIAAHTYNPDEVLEYLLSYCRNHKRIFLYGAGDFGALYAGILKEENIPIAGFLVSKNKEKTVYLGVPVYNVAEVENSLSINDGIVLSLRANFHSNCLKLLPHDISALSFNDRQTYALMRRYLKNNISDKMQTHLQDSGLLNSLKTDMRLQGECIKSLSRLCNKNENRPNLLFEHRVIYFARSDRQGVSTSFPIDDTGIVIQGPIQRDADFTLETALFYRKLYPMAPIVISTWKGEMYDEMFGECKNNNIDVLENIIPRKGGGGNHIFQMTSSYLGIKYISDNYKVRYVLKCRTDQRIFREDILLYLKDLMKAYPPLGNAVQSRIVLDQISAFPFWIADFSAFGMIEDLLKFYFPRVSDGMYYTRRHFKRYENLSYLMAKAWEYYKDGNMGRLWDDIYSFRGKRLGRIACKFMVPEIWIPYSFYDSYIEKIEPERIVAQYINFLVKYVVSLDSIEWMRYWHKYDEDRLRLMGDAVLRYDWKKIFYSHMDKVKRNHDK